MNYSVPDTLLNDILKYLGSRPYVEVFTLVQGIQKLAEQASSVAATPRVVTDESTNTGTEQASN
jgi:hypothetical protein